MVKSIFGEKTIKLGKSKFLLALSVTKTCSIKNITQAGLPGLIHLTPTLDAEIVCTGKVFSLSNIAQTQKGVPTPAIITRAVKILTNFDLEILDLGLEERPKVDCKVYEFGLKPSNRIDQDAQIEAQAVFEKGREFGKNYHSDTESLILAESVPAGTTTAYASALALGYNVSNLFSSSFMENPFDIKEKVVNNALYLLNSSASDFENLSKVSDNMLLFYAGFVSVIKEKYEITLAGGTQMASLILILKKLGFNLDNIKLVTTKWIVEDKNSDIAKILSLVDFKEAYYADFSFKDSKIEALKLYDKGEAKEGVGSGAAIAYAYSMNYNQKEILDAIENFFL